MIFLQFLKNNNIDLLEANIQLRENVEISEKQIEELNNKLKDIFNTLLKIDTNTSNTSDQYANSSKLNINKDLTLDSSNIVPQKHSLIISPNDISEISKNKWSQIASKKLPEIQINK